MKIAIVIPTYNESENIGKLESAILDIAKKNKFNLSIIFVDDNSPDGTGRIEDNLAKKSGCEIVEHRLNVRGLGSSYVMGFKDALKIGADLVIGMDADFSHNPKYIPALIKKIDEGYDVSIGSRYIDGGKIIGWNMRRRLMSKFASRFSRYVLGLKVNDVSGSFRCFKRKVLEKIDLDSISSEGYSFFEEVLFKVQKNNFKIAEVPIVFVDRKKGKSKLSRKEIPLFLFKLINLKISEVKNSRI